MKRVYTDERFPGLEIVNEGRTSFSVVVGGKEVSSFESWELPNGTITEAFAQRRAEAYFERLFDSASHPEMPEMPQQPVKTSLSGQDLTRMIDKLMAQERNEQDPQRKQFLRHHLLNLMRQEESLAEAVVNHLIEAL